MRTGRLRARLFVSHVIDCGVGDDLRYRIDFSTRLAGTTATRSATAVARISMEASRRLPCARALHESDFVYAALLLFYDFKTLRALHSTCRGEQTFLCFKANRLLRPHQLSSSRVRRAAERLAAARSRSLDALFQSMRRPRSSPYRGRGLR